MSAVQTPAQQLAALLTTAATQLGSTVTDQTNVADDESKLETDQAQESTDNTALQATLNAMPTLVAQIQGVTWPAAAPAPASS
jgi:hypothetical protein